MTVYAPPLREFLFTLETIGRLDALAAIPAYDVISTELAEQVLEEAGKLGRDVIAPTNPIGDRQRITLENGVVRMPEAFHQAYRAYVDGGWPGVPFDPDYGGQGLPWVLSCQIQEVWTAGNMAFSLIMLLNQGAIEALAAHGTAEQKATYLDKMVAGSWTGTMNLTEPQAGSDLGDIKTRAVPAGDGSWRITGQKIFITFGEHDLSDNIIHLVLARTPGAPAGTRGISCFIVPKFLPQPDGTPGQRNDLACVALEHKLGIHGSPTCVMAFGDNDACVGYLLGQENRGLPAMFTMMNNARLSVGLQGLAVAERAYQQARAYANERRQGRLPGTAGAAPIVAHPDVRRMLMTMCSTIDAMRAMVCRNALALDLARAAADPEEARAERALADLLTPITKSWCTDRGVDLASLNIQIHGGMGFIEETGAAQHWRDARIAPIYEGTNGIQAIDLVTRKLAANGAAAVHALIAEMQAFQAELATEDGDLGAIAAELGTGIAAFAQATAWLLDRSGSAPDDVLANAMAYLEMAGAVIGGYLLARMAVAAADKLAGQAAGDAFLEGRIVSARFFAEQRLGPAAALLGPVTRGNALLDRAAALILVN